MGASARVWLLACASSNATLRSAMQDWHVYKLSTAPPWRSLQAGRRPAAGAGPGRGGGHGAGGAGRVAGGAAARRLSAEHRLSAGGLRPHPSPLQPPWQLCTLLTPIPCFVAPSIVLSWNCYPLRTTEQRTLRPEGWLPGWHGGAAPGVAPARCTCRPPPPPPAAPLAPPACRLPAHTQQIR